MNTTLPIPAATATRTADLPLASLPMEVRNFRREADTGGPSVLPAARFELVFATGAPVRRYDWANDRYYLEQLQVTPEAVNLARLERGAPLCNSHNAWSLEDQIGVCDQPVISAGQGTVQAQLSRRESVRGIVMDLEDGVIRNVSVGYVREAIEMVAPSEASGVWVYKVTRWTPMEVSLVPIPADMDSQVRSVDGKLQDGSGRDVRSFPCAFTAFTASTDLPLTAPAPISADASRAAAQILQETKMDTTIDIGGAPTVPATTTTTPVMQVRAAANDAADITDLCVRHNVPTLAADMIRQGVSLDAARASVLAELAVRDAHSGGNRNVTRITTVQDAMQTRMNGIEQAILHRITPGAKLDDNGRQYRGMSLLEIGREFLEASGINTRGMDRMKLAGEMLHFRQGGMQGTSDFSSLFANVANKRLRGAYDENPGTYALWARQAPNAPDFKNITVAQMSGAPDLLQTNEHGEFKYGKMTDGAEQYAVLTYGRIVSISRQAIVNDDLRTFERLVTSFGSSSRRLENRTVYAQLTANAALADGGTLFNATAQTTTGGHANLASGSTSALQISSLISGRTGMRLQKGLTSEELSIAPSFLIVPASLEQTAYQLTSKDFVPAKQSDVNEFRIGGRTSLETIVEPILDSNSATAWYLAAGNSQIDTVEYCYLDGAEGPIIDSEPGFETDGISYKCRLDFAAKAIDYRGLYKGAGA